MSHRHESIMFMCALVIGAGFAAPAAAVPTERNLYVTDSENGLIYLVTPSKSVSVLVSEADITSATGASEARFTDNGMFFDLATEKLYFTDSESDSILVRDSTGAVSVIATEADIFAVTGAQNADDEDAANTVFAVDVATGTPSVLASFGSDIDTFLTLAPNGDVIVADDDSSNSISRVTSGGVVTAFLDESTISSVIGGGGLIWRGASRSTSSAISSWLRKAPTGSIAGPSPIYLLARSTPPRAPCSSRRFLRRHRLAWQV